MLARCTFSVPLIILPGVCDDRRVDYVVAQVNIGRLTANATAIRAFEQDAEGADGGILINLSVWESVEALGAYVYGEAHLAVLRRRRQWFELSLIHI